MGLNEIVQRLAYQSQVMEVLVMIALSALYAC
jgi:hypothetical protein